ncbi:MAG: T9SS type A sorting domain-containing protein [Lewinellaceae bacterium]|nr:T9SS type A sorting domain-containing protein [Lewinellaceae bacterium]
MYKLNIQSAGPSCYWQRLLYTLSFMLTGVLLFGQADIRSLKYQFPGSDTPVELNVEVADGLVILDGDIILGTESGLFGIEDRAAVISGSSYRWDEGLMPYEIEADHPQRNLIIQAIGHVNENTTLHLTERNPSLHADYVRFRAANVCNSYVGRIGGRQDINIAPGCGFGSIVHEICHAAGLFHEQSRSDRDEFVTILWENIQDGREFNFQTYLDAGVNGFDHEDYNYNSIMHYGPLAFSSNGQPTIEVNSPPAKPGTTIGQRDGLSLGDILAINSIYPCDNVWENYYRVCGSESQSIFTTVFISASENGCTSAVPADQLLIWQTGDEIIFYPGFTAPAGADFLGRLEESCAPHLRPGPDDPKEAQKMEDVAYEKGSEFTSSISVYPNPFQTTTTFAFVLPQEGEATLQVFDPYGRQVHHKSENLPAGHHQWPFDGSRLSSGVYTVVLRFEDTVLTERMAIAK